MEGHICAVVLLTFSADHMTFFFFTYTKDAIAIFHGSMKMGSNKIITTVMKSIKGNRPEENKKMLIQTNKKGIGQPYILHVKCSKVSAF